MVVLDQDLSVVQPSWIQDGYGIQGDQDEYRFDDDLPWDITAWTRDHPDQDDFTQACCPTTGCPSVTFDGLEFCCTSFLGGSKLFEDAGTDPPFVLNGLNLCMRDVEVTPPCDISCANTPTCTLVGVHVYDSEDCSGDPHPVALALEVDVFVVRVSGVYHVFAINGDNSVFLFYGTTTDLGTPASNQIVCGETTEINNDATTCLFGGPFIALGVAGNGTASFGSTCPTGACCPQFGDCIPDTFQNICEDCLGGTYTGDGTPCDPNPC